MTALRHHAKLVINLVQNVLVPPLIVNLVHLNFIWIAQHVLIVQILV